MREARVQSLGWEWQPTPVFLPRESPQTEKLGRLYSPWDLKEQDMTEQLSTSTHMAFPVPVIENIIFPLYILGSFMESQLTIYAWIFSQDFYSLPSIFVSVSVPIPYCFDYCSLEIQFEIRNCDIPSFLRLLLLFVGPL